jgi:hypothetical protein
MRACFDTACGLLSTCGTLVRARLNRYPLTRRFDTSERQNIEWAVQADGPAGGTGQKGTKPIRRVSYASALVFRADANKASGREASPEARDLPPRSPTNRETGSSTSALGTIVASECF